MANPQTRPSASSEPVRNGARPQVIDSRALLSGCNELQIRHGGEIYRLRLTQSGKLILTK